MPKFTYRTTANQIPAEWELLCPQGTYRLLSPTQLPEYFPSSLLAKTDSVLLVNSGNLYMVDFNRVDKGKIDQQPFGFVFISGYAACSGGYLDHGNWSGRTIDMPQHFRDAVAASGIGNCYPFGDLPRIPSGPVSELAPTYQSAFSNLTSYLSGFIPVTTIEGEEKQKQEKSTQY